MENLYFANEEEARHYRRIQFAKDCGIYLVLTFFALFTLVPFMWMVLSSFKSVGEIQDKTVPATMFPKDWTWNFNAFFNSHYEAGIVDGKMIYVNGYTAIWRFMANTILVGAVTTIGTVVVTVLAAFAFARLSFKGRELIFSILLATMMIPGEMMIITNFTTVANLGWLDRYEALIIPFIGSVFYTFFLRQNFKQIPNELYYAAKVDGVGDFAYLWKVMIPISMPSIITITILSMIGSWNAYIWPRTVTSERSMQLVTNGIMELFRGGETVGTNLDNYRMAGVLMVSLPLLIAFVVFKKYIMNGVSRSGIKG